MNHRSKICTLYLCVFDLCVFDLMLLDYSPTVDVIEETVAVQWISGSPGYYYYYLTEENKGPVRPSLWKDGAPPSDDPSISNCYLMVPKEGLTIVEPREACDNYPFIVQDLI